MNYRATKHTGFFAIFGTQQKYFKQLSKVRRLMHIKHHRHHSRGKSAASPEQTTHWRIQGARKGTTEKTSEQFLA
jgi:hypothetical protein